MKQLITPEVAAEKLAVSVKTIKNLLRCGKLRGVKVGNLWRLQEEALEEYLKKQTGTNRSLVSDEEIAVTQLEAPRQFRTSLGQQLWDIRSRFVASGEPLLDWEGIEQEVAERRGEAE